jgi:hypothetical protein
MRRLLAATALGCSILVAPESAIAGCVDTAFATDCDAATINTSIDIVAEDDYSIRLDGTTVNGSVSLVVYGKGNDGSIADGPSQPALPVTIDLSNDSMGDFAALSIYTDDGDIWVGGFSAIVPGPFGGRAFPDEFVVGAITASGFSRGIDLQTGDPQLGGPGSIDLNISGGRIVTEDGQGIFASSFDGDIRMIVGTDIKSDFRGIDARADGTGNVGLEVLAGTRVTGGNDWPNDPASNEFGVLINVQSGDGVAINNGIVKGAAGLDVESTSGGNIAISGSGKVVGTSQFGVRGWAQDFGDVDIDYAGDVTAAMFGIGGFADGGSVTIASQGDVIGGTHGINARATAGGLSITIGGGNVTGKTGYGVFAEAGSAGSETIIRNSGVVTGELAGIAVATGPQDATIDNRADGLIQNGSLLSSGLAIDSRAAAALIKNDGTILGRIATGGGNDRLVNGGVWNSSGESRFGPGDDVLGNHGIIQLRSPFDAPSSGAASDAAFLSAVVNFGAGNDRFVNRGTLSAIAGTTAMRGLEAFDNAAGGTIEMRDGSPDDTLIIDGTFQSGGTLGLDVFLGGAGSASDTLVAAAIIADPADGPTLIALNNTNLGAGVLNADGIVLVENGGGTALPPGSFALANGPIDTGLYRWDLFAAANGNVVVRSSFDSEDLPPLQPQDEIIDIWHDTSEKNEQRIDEILPDITGPGVPRPQVDAGGYVQIVGSLESRDVSASFKVGGVKTTIGDNYDLGLYGVIFGLDALQTKMTESGKPFAYVAGAFGGIINADVDFDEAAGNQEFDGGVAGGYAAMAYGPWRLHGLLKSDFGNARFSSVTDHDSAHYFAPGVSINAGYRHAIGRAYVQPLATFAYVHTSMDDITLDGTDIEFHNTDSVRGRAGVRIGANLDSETHVIEPWLQASVWHEFAGETLATFTGAGGALDFGGNGAGTYGEVGAGANLINKAGRGFSGNLRTDVVFGEQQLIGVSGKIGVEYRFPAK